MIRIFYRNGDRISRETRLESLVDINTNQLLWIDLIDPTDAEKHNVQQLYKVNFQSETQIEEIESSSRFLETDDFIIANSNFLIQENEQYISEPVSFILKDHYLITFRYTELRSFADVIRKFETTSRSFPTGFHVLVSIFETRIDLDADLLEAIAKDINKISSEININRNMQEEVVFKIARFQETTMLLRENIIDKQRVISAMLKNEYFPPECNQRLRIIIKDINSLLYHSEFGFERLEYLQNTFLGLINIEQNKIIKIFTVASVVFMPPTLIASLYGMNFPIPELRWEHGYLFAVILMLLSVGITLAIFRSKKWI
ncbi:MAG: magnesium/cobalt transporter CorA [Bacteroidia bacterium]|nr:magnesium/cobalt transporter CorA [Bacteroidia bacterium]